MNFSLSSALETASLVLFAAVLGCTPNDGVRDLELGRAAYELHDLKKAERYFSKSLDAAPDDVDRLLYLARVKLDLGELQETRELLVKAQLLSSDIDVRLLVAQLAWHEKDYKASAVGYAAIGEDKTFEPAIRAQGLVGLGIVEMACNRPHQSRLAFMKAINLDRHNASAWYHLGLLYRDSFAYIEAALEQFEIFARLEAEASPRVQKVKRTVIPALKQQIMSNATERPGVSQRNCAECSTALGKAELAWKKGQYKQSRQAYQEALASDPLSYPAALGLAKAWEKSDTTKEGQKKAYDNYRLACTLRPSAISTFLTAGALASRLGYDSQAIQIYSRAVAANPKSFEALDGLIRSLSRSKGTAGVAKAYQQYRDSLPRKK